MTRGESLRRAAKFKKDKSKASWGQGAAYSIFVSMLSLFIFAGDLTEFLRADRLAHFFVACILTQIYFLLTPQRRCQAVEAIILTLSIGAMKEIMDPQMEFFDLIMNLCGTLFAVGIHSFSGLFESQNISRSKA